MKSAKNFLELVDLSKNCKDIKTATNILKANTPQSDLIDKARNFSIKAHEKQKRHSGEPYVIHPILVAAFVGFLGGDEDSICAALLHDTVEDTDKTIKDLHDTFNKDIAYLVEGMTKIEEQSEDNEAKDKNHFSKNAMSFRKMIINASNNVKVLTIKLCDRTHNMITLDSLPQKKRERIATETLTVYTPIAHRLGINKIKNLFEDLAFYNLFRKDYNRINAYLKNHEQDMQLALNEYILEVRKHLLANDFKEDDFVIEKRIKPRYSIHLKTQRQGISIDEVMDLIAIKILVKKPMDCYKVLGLIHQNFKPITSRFKDYIANPKKNGYQTIHTSIFTSNNQIIETQIKTFEMDHSAELGIAAHWKYKHNGTLPDLKWIENIDTHGLYANTKKSFELAKSDLFTQEVTVSSPDGEKYTLPYNATALDFAYMIHTDIGNHAFKAFINNKQAELLDRLQDGDIVRIMSDERHFVNSSAINSVVTQKAKHAINVICRDKVQEINALVVSRVLANVFTSNPKKITNWIKNDNIVEKYLKSSISITTMKRLIRLYLKHHIKNSSLRSIMSYKYQLKEQTFANILIHSNFYVAHTAFGFCCYPRMGDEIIGIQQPDDSLEIHHKLCSHARIALQENANPVFFVTWAQEKFKKYKIKVSLGTKVGILADFISFLAKHNANTLKINTIEDTNQTNEKNPQKHIVVEVDISETADEDEFFQALEDTYTNIQINPIKKTKHKVIEDIEHAQ